jgi:serine/threonine protein kinase
MAPELIQGIYPGFSSLEDQSTRTPASDIYSLGATLWALLTGQSPCKAVVNDLSALLRIAEGRLPWLPPKGVFHSGTIAANLSQM